MDLRTLSRTPADDSAKDQQAPSFARPDAARQVPAPHRRWATRVVLPLTILLATLALIAYAARDVLLPATPVDVVRATALTSRSSAGNVNDAGDETDGAGHVAVSSTSVVAQAPGWVEPDPYPAYVTALADGVVSRMLVLEGEMVSAGQTLVELVRDDAELALAQAQAALTRQQAVLTAAEADYDEPVALQRIADVTSAMLAQAEADLVRLDARVAQEEAKLAELTAAYDRLAGLGERSASAQQVEAAMYQVQSQQAVVDATRQFRPGLEAGVERAQAERTAALRDLELKTSLRRVRDEAAAQVVLAQVRLAEAQLRLERMTLRSPVDGVVMNRLVAPGDKLRLNADGMHTAHAIHLYDPGSLQVRVDVPLADAASVGVGQEAVIVVDVLPDVEFRGVVTRLVHQADIGKNTVQFKVAITDPSPLLTPDMLARVKFLGRAGGGGASTPSTAGGNSDVGSGGPVALRDTAIVELDGASFVWWVSPTDSRLVKKPVTLGTQRGDGTIEIRTGLNPGDAVVDNPDPALHEGQRVRIRGAT
ncbi:efflux RND transporter periplasmic adaptor subunit [Phycisphaeraceae bacterium D3-23]